MISEDHLVQQASSILKVLKAPAGVGGAKTSGLVLLIE